LAAWDDALARRVQPFPAQGSYGLQLRAREPRLLHLKQAPFRIQVGDERIMSWEAIGAATELSLQGRAAGSTVMNVWFGDRNDPARQTVLSFQVNVLPGR
jgi:hypothetical protein